MVSGGGVALNLIFHGDLLGLVAWVVGALFIPSFALCLGVWSGSSKVFEFLYTLLWYVGPFNKIELLDFMGATPSSVVEGYWQSYLVITFALLGLTVVGRKWQIQRG